MGQWALEAQRVRSSQPASTAESRAVRMVVRSAIFASDLGELGRRTVLETGHGAAVPVGARLQQLGDLLKREPETLRRLDHP